MRGESKTKRKGKIEKNKSQETISKKKRTNEAKTAKSELRRKSHMEARL